jgi:hypothetical protein
VNASVCWRFYEMNSDLCDVSGRCDADRSNFSDRNVVPRAILEHSLLSATSSAEFMQGMPPNADTGASYGIIFS